MTQESSFDKKIKLWCSKLLDLSNRNRMLNYKKRKTSSFELDGEFHILFKRLFSEGYTFDTILPRRLDSEYESEYNEKREEINSRTKKLEYIRKIIKSADDEMGFNIGYIAFGFLRWSEPNDSSREFESPLLLVPIEIQRDNITSPFHVRFKDGEEIQMNPVVFKKISDVFGINLNSEYETEDIEKTLENIEHKVNSFGWKIVKKATAFQKLAHNNLI
jgi:hypothetical protein